MYCRAASSTLTPTPGRIPLAQNIRVTLIIAVKRARKCRLNPYLVVKMLLMNPWNHRIQWQSHPLELKNLIANSDICTIHSINQKEKHTLQQ